MSSTPSERWPQVKEIFLEAVRHQPGERDAFLATACAEDAALRAEVQSLLDFHVEAMDAGFLDSLTTATNTPREALEALAAALEVTLREERTGLEEGDRAGFLDVEKVAGVPADLQRFAHHQLLKRVGQGGMGVVYKARQLSLNRVVALKMIRAGRFSSPGEVERFRQEAAAAAKLDHPGIAAVYEVGLEEGHHYYTMAFVEGKSLSEQLKESQGPLEPRQAARLVAHVADAIQYAHERGVIHRDIKPTNILLDSQGAPRVVDFGLAKELETDSGLTSSGQILGTPSFMSPEQASGDTHKVTHTADVYALGAVLYTLITGHPPFLAANVGETLRQVLQDEPVRPRLLNSSLPKDLETICLKCLAKDPARRYDTARQVAEELRRFLDGEAILARPVSSLEQAVRWCRRNRAAAALIALVATALPTIIVVLAVLDFRLNEARAEAEFERQKADLMFQEAQAAVHDQFTLVSEETLLNQPGMQPLRHRLLLGSQTYYEQFLAQRSGEPQLRVYVADIHLRLGVITEQLAEPSRAEAHYARAERLQRVLVEEQSDAARRALLGDILTRQGHLHTRLDRPQLAHAAFTEAVAQRRQVVEQDKSAEAQRKLANAYMNLGITRVKLGAAAGVEDQQRAQTLRAQILAQHPGHLATQRDLAKGAYNLVLPISDPHAPQLKQALDSAADTLRRLHERDPASLETQHLLAVTHHMRANLHSRRGEHGPAEQLYDQALKELERLHAQNPQVTDYTGSLARALLDLGDHHHSRKVLPQAVQHWRRADELLSVLLDTGHTEYLDENFDMLQLLAQSEYELNPDDPRAAADTLAKHKRLLQRVLRMLDNNPAAAAELPRYRQQLDEVEATLRRLVTPVT